MFKLISSRVLFITLFLATAVFCSQTNGQSVSVSVSPGSVTVGVKSVNSAEVIGTNTAQYNDYRFIRSVLAGNGGGTTG
jgi:hypothetical protein